MLLWYLTYAIYKFNGYLLLQKENNIKYVHIHTFLHIKYLTSCTEHISSIKLTFIILNQHTHFIHLFLEFMF